jgi:mannose-6-phosphate isomerase-like protein (cupin superfamily)
VTSSLVPPGGGDRFTVRGSALLFKAGAAATDGAISLHERWIPAGGRRPPAHRHADRLEAFWVRDGVAEFELDGETCTAAADTFVLVPRGAAHTFGATAAGPARVLVLHSPALDDYFRELDQLWAAGTPSREVELALMRRHGMEPA